MDAAWLHHFEAGSTFHAVMVGACAAVIAAACVVGRRLRRLDRADGGQREARFGAALGWSIVAWQAFATVWRVLPGQWDLNESLPLHLCRWTGWIAAVCLITGWRRVRALSFFWGLGLSVQGFVTPMWNDGLASVAFWLYWVGHLQIVGVAVYDLVVRAYTPRWRDLGFAVVAGLGYVLLTVGLNLALDTNYSYLGSWDYGRASVVDRLGDFPDRVYKMVGGAMVLFVLMFGACHGLRKLSRTTAGAPDDRAVAA